MPTQILVYTRESLDKYRDILKENYSSHAKGKCGIFIKWNGSQNLNSGHTGVYSNFFQFFWTVENMLTLGGNVDNGTTEETEKIYMLEIGKQRFLSVPRIDGTMGLSCSICHSGK